MNSHACPHCGVPIEMTANECPHCGSKTATAEAATRRSMARLALYAGIAVAAIGSIAMLTTETWDVFSTGIILALVGGALAAFGLFRLDRQNGWRRIMQVGQVAGAAIMLLSLRCFQDTGSGVDANTVSALFGIGTEIVGLFLLAVCSVGARLLKPKSTVTTDDRA